MAYATYTYTDNGQQATVADANGNLTRYIYDGHDRLVEWRFPHKINTGVSSTTDVESYQYDANGNRTNLTKRDGQTNIIYQYDALDRMISKDLPGLADDVTYGYDLLGRQTSVSVTGHAISYVYDKAGRLLSTTAGGRTLSYLYDPASNRTRITWPDVSPSFYVSYHYDVLNRVTDIREQGTASLASYDYDDLSRRTKVTLGNGTRVDYGYEADSALDYLDNVLTGQSVRYDFDYNRVNQISQLSLSNTAYRWSGHYNRNTQDQYDGLNQATRVGARPIGHDANGNLTSDLVRDFSYDAENRLVSATSQGVAASYAYSPTPGPSCRPTTSVTRTTSTSLRRKRSD